MLLLLCGQRIAKRMNVTRDGSFVDVQMGLNIDKMQLFFRIYGLMRTLTLPRSVNFVGNEKTTIRRNVTLGITHFVNKHCDLKG